MKYNILILFLLVSSPAFAGTHIDAKFKFPPEERHQVLKQYGADTTTEAFLKLSQKEQVQVLQEVIDRYYKQGVKAKYTATEYVDIIDNLMAKNPEYMGISLGQIFREILLEEGSLAKEE